MTHQQSAEKLRVFVGTDSDEACSQTVFPAATGSIFCMAEVPPVADDASITFTFEIPVASNNGSMSVSGTVSMWPSTETGLKYTALHGRLDPGEYRCRVDVDGLPAGSAAFIIE